MWSEDCAQPLRFWQPGTTYTPSVCAGEPGHSTVGDEQERRTARTEERCMSNSGTGGKTASLKKLTAVCIDLSIGFVQVQGLAPGPDINSARCTPGMNATDQRKRVEGKCNLCDKAPSEVGLMVAPVCSHRFCCSCVDRMFFSQTVIKCPKCRVSQSIKQDTLRLQPMEELSVERDIHWRKIVREVYCKPEHAFKMEAPPAQDGSGGPDGSGYLIPYNDYLELIEETVYDLVNGSVADEQKQRQGELDNYRRSNQRNILQWKNQAAGDKRVAGGGGGGGGKTLSDGLWESADSVVRKDERQWHFNQNQTLAACWASRPTVNEKAPKKAASIAGAAAAAGAAGYVGSVHADRAVQEGVGTLWLLPEAMDMDVA